MYYFDIATTEVEKVCLTYDSMEIDQLLVKLLSKDKEVAVRCSFGGGRLTNCLCFPSAICADSTICELFYNMEVKEMWVAVTIKHRDEVDSIFISLLHTRHHEYKKVVIGGFIVYNIKFK
ncbi:MAG: hypothetical protein FJZ43_01215 [Candidatus Staskawiczbacteria bacterium]|nr:hypothetical protein [Candidatus Staskawiczbacteria bacterium]